MHTLTNYNSKVIQSQTDACRSARGTVGLMGEKNTVHLLKKFQMTVCQNTICTAADLQQPTKQKVNVELGHVFPSRSANRLADVQSQGLCHSHSPLKSPNA